MTKRIKTSAFLIGLLFVILLFLFEGCCPGILSSILSSFMPVGIAWIITVIIMTFAVYLMVFLISTKLLKLSMEEIGIPRIRFDFKWVISGVVLAAAVLIIYFAMPGKSGIVDSSISLFDRLLISIAIAFLAGVNEEIIFRGLFMHIMKYRFNVCAAIIVPSFIFAAIHLLNGQLTAVGAILLLVGATAAGCMFSLIALVKDSIWNSVAVHAIWDLFIGEMIVVANEPKGREMFYKSLDTANPVITGGGYGIDCSVICIACFAIVSVIAYAQMKSTKKEPSVSHK